jgi:nucleotide-binding universal stress UspA family protein
MTIAVAYDGSEGSTRALERARSDARAEEAQLVVIAVAGTALVGTAGPTGSIAMFAPDLAAQELRAGAVPAELEPVLEEAKRRAPEAEVVWAAGDPAMTIVHLAEHHGASRLYVGPHHHRWFDVLTGGDTVKAIRHRAQFDVVVVAD